MINLYRLEGFMINQVGSPRDLGGRPLGTLYATTRGDNRRNQLDHDYRHVLSPPKKSESESSKSLKQSLKSLSTITLRCTYQEKLTMEEVKWNGFPSVGTFQLFKSICSFLWHFKNIYLIFINFVLTRYHVCLVVAYDKASGKAHRF